MNSRRELYGEEEIAARRGKKKTLGTNLLLKDEFKIFGVNLIGWFMDSVLF